MSCDSPRWEKLRQIWKNLCPHRGCEELLRAYAEPSRGYHNLEHLEEVLGWVEHLPLPSAQLCLLRLALFYHDAVYVSRRSDNEAASAAWAVGDLSGWLPPADLQEVEALILDTTHGRPPHNALGAWMVDTDLSVLGSSWERFERYHQDVRKEYSWVPWFLYRTRRRQVLGQFLRRSRIYLTDYFFERLEARARENLTRVLQF